MQLITECQNWQIEVNSSPEFLSFTISLKIRIAIYFKYLINIATMRMLK